MAEFFKKHRPVQSQHQFNYRSAMAAPAPVEQTPGTPVSVMQVHDSYIVAQTADGFVIVDQHALHERILYEDLSGRVRNSRLESQRLLIPESFEVTDAEADAVEVHGDLFEKLGIDLVPFGPRTMAVQAFPTLLGGAAPADLVRDLLGILTDKELSGDADRLLDAVLNMAACKAAIKAGKKLSVAEMEQLLADKEHTDYAGRCPHGRPTIIKFTLVELEKQFKRT
jgi:DNA mismatch repair protein MutL